MSGREATDQFPPTDLRHYALLADGERGGLVGPRGEIAWLCAPRWHDPAVFSTMMGGGGVYAVSPADRCVWGGYYQPGTLIWHNRWVTQHNAIVECRDALAMPSRPNRLTLLRQLVPTDDEVMVHVLLDVRAEFGSRRMQITARGEDRATHRRWWTFRSGELYGRWTAPIEAYAYPEGRLVWQQVVGPGAQVEFVLELDSEPIDDGLPVPAQLWDATENAWQADVPTFDHSVAPRDTQHAYAILRGLTSSTGGMVAAATMSLPEQSDEDRNYDYRYAWIRDQCYAGLAVAAAVSQAGPLPLLASSVRFVGERLLADGSALLPAYTVTGDRVPEPTRLDLIGYPGAVNITGNRAADQFQLDGFGDAIQLFATAARLDMLDTDGWRAARTAAAAVAERWQEPDAGIWELDNEWWAHSRLSCVAGLRKLAEVAARNERDELRALADAILGETAKRCTHATGRWQRSPEDERVDAALLLPAVRGATPVDDPHTIATLAAVQNELVDDGYLYRYAPDEGPPGETEGAFLLCGFTLALAQLQQGNRVEAFRWFERNRAASGPAGLLSEEFDVRQRQLRGNLPQSFVHALLFETSVRLADDPR